MFFWVVLIGGNVEFGLRKGIIDGVGWLVGVGFCQLGNWFGFLFQFDFVGWVGVFVMFFEGDDMVGIELDVDFFFEGMVVM